MTLVFTSTQVADVTNEHAEICLSSVYVGSAVFHLRRMELFRQHDRPDLPVTYNKLAPRPSR